MSRTNRKVPATATVKCRKCGRSSQVQVQGPGTTRTYGTIHSATQHGGAIGQAQRNRSLLRRIFGG